MHQMEDQKQSYFKFMEMIPTQGYIGLALGSIALSAMFKLAGKNNTALFVGQWAPTFLLMSLTHKLLHPSHEHAEGEMHSALSEAEHMMRRGKSGSASQ